MSKLIDQGKRRNQTISDEQNTSSARRQCLLVLGMHRSGTSALTRVLNLAGASLPKRLMGASDVSNATGHWEPDVLVQYHDKMLAELDTSWDDWRAFDVDALPVKRREDIRQEISDIIRADYGDKELIVLKEPRICRFAPFFMDVLSAMDIEPLPVLIFRNPLEVMDSLERRDGMSRADAALLWLRHVLEAEKASRSRPRVFTTYAGVLQDWRREFSCVVTTFDLNNLHEPDEIATMVEEFLSPDLRHNIRRSEDVRLDPMLAGWVAEAWEAFQVLVSKSNSPKAQARLDRVARGFEESAPVLAGYIAEVKQEKDVAIADLQGLIEAKETELTSKVEARVSEAAAHEKELSRLAGELRDRATRLAELESERDELAGRIVKVQNALEQAKEKRYALKNGLDEQIVRLKKQLDEKEAALAQESSRHKQMRAELKDLRTNDENLTHKLYKAEAQIVALNKDIEEGGARVNELEAALSGARQLHQVAETSLIEERQGQAALVAAARQQAQSIDLMYRSSTSWKLTSFLRTIGGSLKSLNKKSAGVLRAGGRGGVSPRIISTEAVGGAHDYSAGRVLIDGELKKEEVTGDRYLIEKDIEGIGSYDTVCLFVTYSPDGTISGRAKNYCSSFVKNGIYTILLCATDVPDLRIERPEDGVFHAFVSKQNGGMDFACWALALRIFPDLWKKKRVFFVNDSVYGPFRGFQNMMSKILSSDADYIGLVESHQLIPHYQSFFFVLSDTALRSEVIEQFWAKISPDMTKEEVINQCEIPLLTLVRKTGLKAEALFPVLPEDQGVQINSTHQRWRQLCERGLPFIKVELIRDNPCNLDLRGVEDFLYAGKDCCE